MTGIPKEAEYWWQVRHAYQCPYCFQADRAILISWLNFSWWKESGRV